MLTRLAVLATCGMGLMSAQSPDPTTKLDLFLLIGQSNMAGRGAVEPADREPIPHIFSLNRDLAWVPAVEPVHFDKPFVGSGMARSFARTLLAAHPSASIGLIPCAVGGSSLNEWAPGGKLFTDALARAREAMKAGTLRGILWHQGESDTGSEELASTYRERWNTMITALRKELGASAVPVLIGALGEFVYKENGGKMAFAPLVNQQLASIPLTVPATIFVPSAGLVHKGDQVHFDAPSLREFGRRYALAFMSLEPGWWVR